MTNLIVIIGADTSITTETLEKTGLPVFTPCTPFLRGIAKDPTWATGYPGLYGGSLFSELSRFHAEQPSIYARIEEAFQNQVGREIPISHAQPLLDGEIHLLFAMMLLYHPATQQGFALSIDGNLHPWIQQSILDSIRHSSVQGPIMVSISNPKLLDGLPLSEVSLGVVQSSSRQIHYIKMSDALRRSFDRGQTLSSMFVEGVLGGTPPGF